jgi:hypothetical protein
MKYLILTEAYTGYNEGVNHFAFAKTNNDVFVTPESAKKDFPKLFAKTNFQTIDLVLADFQPDYNPPASNGFAIVIPQEFQWVFPVKIEGYTIPMFDFAGKKVVEASYLLWKKAFDAFDKTQNSDFKNALMKIFIYAKTNPEIIALK